MRQLLNSESYNLELEKALKESSILPPILQDEKLGCREIESLGWVPDMQAAALPSLPLLMLARLQATKKCKAALRSGGANARFHLSFPLFFQITTKKGKEKNCHSISFTPRISPRSIEKYC